MPLGAIPFPFGICRICNDKATGVHYGVATCEGCKGFFKRSITRGDKYKCFFGGECDLTPKNRNRCKSCRFKRCLETGMSVEAVRMGRIPKVEKEKALEVFHQEGSDFNKLELKVEQTGSGSYDFQLNPKDHPDYNEEMGVLLQKADFPAVPVSHPSGCVSETSPTASALPGQPGATPVRIPSTTATHTDSKNSDQTISELVESKLSVTSNYKPMVVPSSSVNYSLSSTGYFSAPHTSIGGIMSSPTDSRIPPLNSFYNTHNTSGSDRSIDPASYQGHGQMSRSNFSQPHNYDQAAASSMFHGSVQNSTGPPFMAFKQDPGSELVDNSRNMDYTSSWQQHQERSRHAPTIHRQSSIQHVSPQNSSNSYKERGDYMSGNSVNVKQVPLLQRSQSEKYDYHRPVVPPSPGYDSSKPLFAQDVTAFQLFDCEDLAVDVDHQQQSGATAFMNKRNSGNMSPIPFQQQSVRNELPGRTQFQSQSQQMRHDANPQQHNSAMFSQNPRHSYPPSYPTNSDHIINVPNFDPHNKTNADFDSYLKSKTHVTTPRDTRDIAPMDVVTSDWPQQQQSKTNCNLGGSETDNSMNDFTEYRQIDSLPSRNSHSDIHSSSMTSSNIDPNAVARCLTSPSVTPSSPDFRSCPTPSSLDGSTSSQSSQYSPVLIKVLIDQVVESNQGSDIMMKLKQKLEESRISEKAVCRLLKLIKQRSASSGKHGGTGFTTGELASLPEGKTAALQKFLQDVSNTALSWTSSSSDTLSSCSGSERNSNKRTLSETGIYKSLENLEMKRSAMSRDSSENLHSNASVSHSSSMSSSNHSLQTGHSQHHHKSGMSNSSNHHNSLRPVKKVAYDKEFALSGLMRSDSSDESMDESSNHDDADNILSAHRMKLIMDGLNLGTKILFRLKPEHREKKKMYRQGKINLRVLTDSDEDVGLIYEKLISGIPDLNQRVLGFCDSVPGFSGFSKEDRDKLMKRSYYDMWTLSYAEYFENNTSYWILPTGEIYSAEAMRKILNDEIVNTIMKFSDEFNPLQLLDIEISLLCAIRLTSPESLELNDKVAVEKLNSQLLEMLAQMLKDNHPSNHTRLLLTIFKLIPLLEAINRIQSEIIGKFSTKFEKKKQMDSALKETESDDRITSTETDPPMS